MGKTTDIQWTESTWNPWYGCKKVSPGCKNCYMYRDQKRFGKDPQVVTLAAENTFRMPLRLKKPARIFTCSWSDFFIEDADDWRNGAWEIIKKTPQHTYQVLTKRPELIAERLPADWGDGYANVWLGVSVENNDYLWRAETLATIPAVGWRVGWFQTVWRGLQGVPGMTRIPTPPLSPQAITSDMRFTSTVYTGGRPSMIGGVVWQDKSGVWHASIDYWWYGEGSTRDEAIQKVLEAYCDPQKV